MTMTKEERYWHTVYETLPVFNQGVYQEAIDDAYDSLVFELRTSGLFCADDDRAERMIASITKYIFQSDPELMERLFPSKQEE